MLSQLKDNDWDKVIKAISRSNRGNDRGQRKAKNSFSKNNFFKKLKKLFNKS